MSSKQMGRRKVRESCNNAVENHGCPLKMNAASVSKRIYSLINHSGKGMNSLSTTNHFIY